MLSPCQIKALKKLLKNKISTSMNDLKKHSQNQFFSKNYLSDAICYAESENDILILTDFCIENKIPIIPYGSGTSVEGHTVPIYGGICLNLSKMDSIIEFNPKDHYVVVLPGLAYNKLNEFLAPHGFYFPVEAGWGASIGGMVATNASGAGATDSGSMAQNILGATIITYKKNRACKLNLGTKSLKSSAGYNLTNLFVGSEGTLGIITEVSLKIRKIPSFNFTICAQLEEINQAVDFVIAMKHKVRFRKVELLDRLQTKACLLYSNIEMFDHNKNTILIELSGIEGIVKNELETITTYLKKNHGVNIQVFKDKKSAEFIWMMRKNACPAAISLMGKGKKAIATDVSVPLSKLAECINNCYVHMKKLNFSAPLVSHIGDGNFHFTLLVDPNDKNELKKSQEFNKMIIDEALKYKGTCTGEHGIGLGKKSSLINQHGENLFLMCKIKEALDPYNIFNPGKIFDFESILDSKNRPADISYFEKPIRAKI